MTAITPPRAGSVPREEPSGQSILPGFTLFEESQDRLLRHDAVTGARDHTQLRVWDCPKHLDGVLPRDDVAVADDDQGGRSDTLQLLVREAWFDGPHLLQTSENYGPMVFTIGGEVGVGGGHWLGIGIE